MLYARYGDVDALRRVLIGIAPRRGRAADRDGGENGGAAVSQPARAGAVSWCSAVAAAVGVMRWPLLWVLAVLAPVSIALAWWVRR